MKNMGERNGCLLLELSKGEIHDLELQISMLRNRGYLRDEMIVAFSKEKGGISPLFFDLISLKNTPNQKIMK